ncbi:MAG: ABC transporter permease [Crenarchaeota archaeon]|nr:ABC transporter permease [Thermoproteota archaeon]
MGLATYVINRVWNAVIVILVAVFVCSLVFNALMQINASIRINQAVQTTIQRLAAQGFQSMVSYIQYNAYAMRKWHIAINISGKTYSCAAIFTNPKLMKSLEAKGVDLEGVAKDCIEKFVRLQQMYQWGLNQPYIVRVFLYTWRTLTFNLGPPLYTYEQYGEVNSVFQLLLIAMARSVVLFTVAYAISMAIAIYLGLRMARNAGGPLDRAVSVVGMVSNSMPLYWVAMIMILVFSAELGIFPSRAYETPPQTVAQSPLALFEWWSWHLALPIITIVMLSIGPAAYVVRNMVVNVMREDFVVVARAKGLPERDVMYKHVLRAASPPIATNILLGILNTFFGAMISERVFQWPGMGFLYWLAISNGDIVVLMGLNYMFILLFVTLKLGLDILYCFLDPRIRVSRAG